MIVADIDPKVREDLEWFGGLLKSHLRGELSDDDFAPDRLKMGVYGQRQGAGIQMFRIKVPYGGLNAEKLRAAARIARDFGGGVIHVTTRQNLQIHHIPIDRIETAMEIAAESGLFSREACGNTIRNVVGCPLAGACRYELFDATPWAHALVHRFLRHPEFQNLPRKFKISFTACPQPCPDCGADEPVGWLHDLGFEGRVEEGRIVFKLWIGGGLGNAPKYARVWPETLTPEQIFPTAEAALKLFNAEGNRQNRARARMKFLVQKLGWEEFVRRVREIRATLPPETPQLAEFDERPASGLHSAGRVDPRAYQAWFLRNVRPQRQGGFSSATVPLPIGDATADQFDELADIAETFSDGHVRASPSQNLLLRWVRNENLVALFARLHPAGLAEPTANTIADVTSCPGASTCKLAFTLSKNLGAELRELILREPELFEGERLSVKISGCPNSCGQHHVADIGFYGVARKFGDTEVPAYQVMIRGGLTAGAAAFGQALGKVPARLAPLALRRIVRHYKEGRALSESFFDHVGRVGVDEFRRLIDDLASWTPGAGDNDGELLRDVGAAEVYSSKIGTGECAR
jgi:sulfite reductase beta subunit-like hemoprotein